MISRVSTNAPASTASQPRNDDDKLRNAASQLEGLFVQQLFKAMRETVPQQEGIVSGGAGEEMFTSLLDGHLAAETPKQWASGIGEALYRQLRGAVTNSQDQSAASSTNTVRSTP